MKKLLIIYSFLFAPCIACSQGINNTWLLGNDPGWSNLGRIIFDPSSYQYVTEQRKMSFKGTEATISDPMGNFLMSSNGVWIANANNDTMMNGAGLNPGFFANTWDQGLPIFYGNIILPSPGDSGKITLIHQTELDPNSTLMGIYRTVIDLSLDGGLGGVILKNDSVVQDSMAWGIGACKHGNGRDWWIVFMKDSSDVIYKVLLTPNGISNITAQSLGFLPITWQNGAQLTFSQNGTKLLYATYDNPVSRNSSIVLMDFDRCTGIFSNVQTVLISSGFYLWGLAFSPSGEFIYTCNSGNIFQINSSTLSVDTVAVYDGFISGLPPNCCPTTFFNMYLAANGKIYLTSGSGVQHIHEMNYPDSAGQTCDVQQHAIAIGGNYFHLRAVPNHPNYYLGAADGTICDSLGLNNVNELTQLESFFRVVPNPNNGNFSIMYLLPPGKSGFFYIYDVEGREIFSQVLPSWSTMQQISLPDYISSGVYNCIISSGYERINKKIIVVKE